MHRVCRMPILGPHRCALSCRKTVKCLVLRTCTTWTPEQRDAAIREMNAEMEELFGQPVSSGGPSSFGSPSSLGGPSSFGENVAVPPPQQPPVHASASAPRGAVLAALTQKMQWCAAELSLSTDVERCIRLAACISECARAANAVDDAPLP
jgi:hypothetical protein